MAASGAASLRVHLRPVHQALRAHELIIVIDSWIPGGVKKTNAPTTTTTITTTTTTTSTTT
eukprot:12214150-Heterocapsa_arctica.AAC.1